MTNDPMWKEFQPLWSDLLETRGHVLIAGGYGLFLKQLWLLENREHPIIIPLKSWHDAAPRVTNDLDIVIGLELLASEDTQKMMAKALEKNQFKVVEKHPRWQFQKELLPDRKILVDLHTELPNPENQHLALDKLRVKHKPSLGNHGVHGRQNPEAVGSNLHPFQFTFEKTTISVPNPVTWSIMKLIATRDRHLRAQDVSQNEKDRSFHMDQAIKHVRDVTRVVAMTTREERDRAEEVIGEIRESPAFLMLLQHANCSSAEMMAGENR